MNATATSTFPRITPRLIIGLAILALGALWTLDNLNILESEEITDWWPAVLIVIGIVQFVNRASNRIGSVLLMVVGTLFLADNLGYIDFDLGDLIPLVIALWGAKLVWDALSRRKPRSGIANDDSVVHAFALMAGIQWQSTSRDFQGGDASAIMGGVELDLRSAQIQPGQEVVLDTLSIMGGIEITVPSGWKVVGDVLPIMGGFVDNTSGATTGAPRLTVRGTAVMGSVEVKN